MSNTFGIKFTLTSAGESHGPAYVGIVDGCPSRLPLSEALIQPYLDRRRPGQSSIVTPRNESDNVEILSGVFEGQTTGAPIALLIRNHSHQSADYDHLKDVYRPGHADFTYQAKYGIRDHRGGGRQSARETCLRVAAGAIADLWLKQQGVEIDAMLTHLGDTAIDPMPYEALHQDATVQSIIQSHQTHGTSIGATVKVTAKNVPIGLGEPIFNKLDAQLAHAMMSIPAVKSVQIGESGERDAFTSTGFATNHAGGTLGGISNGEPIVCQVTFKPTSSIMQPITARTTQGDLTELSVKGRHDPCVGIRGIPVVSAMMAMVLMDFFLLNR